MSDDSINNLRLEIMDKVDGLTKLHNEIKRLAADSSITVITAQKAAEVAYKASMDNVNSTKELKAQITELQDSIKPMIKIYSVFDGTGTLMKWLFTYIIIPISVIIGIILSWGRIIRK